MSNKGKNRKQSCLIANSCKNIAGTIALATWFLLFLSNSFMVRYYVRVQIKHPQTVTLTQADISGHFADHPFDPLSVPEDPEASTPEFVDSEDEQKKLIFSDFDFSAISSQEIQTIQAVRLFHFRQSVQQRSDIPLFVLHHSWKDYII